jgi:hypothetical protein
MQTRSVGQRFETLGCRSNDPALALSLKLGTDLR